MLKPFINGCVIYTTLIITLVLGQVDDLLAQKTIPEDFCISSDEQLLLDKLNNLLEDYGKKQLEFSKSLSYVALLHVNDIKQNHPDTSICNLSSWSDKGDWMPCCYNSYVPNQDCMWEKPNELTPYTYRGYELVGYFENGFTPDSVITLWSESKQVLDMILTQGNFKKKKWVCMGLAMNEEYVSVWFGQRADHLGEPDLCSSGKIIAATDSSEIVNHEENVVYYVVYGSFSNPKDAKEAVKRFKKNGFEYAGILKNGELTRVFLDKFETLKEAMFAKQQLSYTYREAWIYKE